MTTHTFTAASRSLARSRTRSLRRLKATAAAIVVIAMAALSAVIPVSVLIPAANAADASSDLRIGDIQPIDSVNPFVEQNDISYDITSLTYDLLLNYKTNDLTPDLANSLAESYETSPDGKTWTFKLHPGITWSDGVPFTSADVKWTYESARDNTTNVMNTYVAGIKSIDTPDKDTVVLHLTDPDVRISSIFVPILPEHVFAKIKLDQLDKVALPLPSVTTAPYIISSYDKTGTTILTANPKFRGAQPAVKRIVETNYGNQDSLLRDIQGGNLDVVLGGNLQWKKQLESSTDIKQWTGSSGGFQEIAFNSCPPAGAGECTGPGKNVHVKVVQDHAIREALAYAVDRPTIAQTVYAGVPQPAYGLISPYYANYFKDWSKDPDIGYPFSLDKAKEVLKAGGWDCSASPCTKDGVKAEFTLAVRTNDPPGQNAMRRVIAAAGQIGIKITLSVVTEDALNNLIYAPSTGDKYAPDFDAFYWAWVGDPTPDFNMSVLQTGSSWSDSYYSNPKYDSLVSDALITQDPAKRLDMLHSAEKIAMTDLPYIPIIYAYSYDLTRNDTWHGYLPSPTGENGSPLGTNWLQVTSLIAGPEAAAAQSTAPQSAASTSGAVESSGTSPETSAAPATSQSPVAASSSGGVPVWLVVVLVIIVVALILVLILRRGKGSRHDGDDDPDDAPFD
ncbi:MAG: ABC transporter substrate-binding protein [Nakamurella sp.]